jgi:hypothetical protein
MRAALLIFGFLCCLVGAQFLLVDKIVLHIGVLPPEDPEAQFYEVDDTAQRHVNLPDSGGYVLLAIGVVCLMYTLAMRRQRERL